jgi:hypothetical protein
MSPATKARVSHNGEWVVKRDNFDYYNAMVEGKPVWHKTRTFFSRDEAQTIVRQLRALGFTGIEALEFHEVQR